MHTRPTVCLSDARPQGPDTVVHQQVRGVAGMVGDGLDLNDVAVVHLKDRWLVAIDVPPVTRVRGGGQDVTSRGDERVEARGQIEGHVRTLRTSGFRRVSPGWQLAVLWTDGQTKSASEFALEVTRAILVRTGKVPWMEPAVTRADGSTGASSRTRTVDRCRR